MLASRCRYLGPCNHEEAYSRVIILAFDAGRKGRQKLLIRTVDTDVLVLAIAYVERFYAQERFLCFMHSQNAIRCRSLQEIAKQNCVSIALFQNQQHLLLNLRSPRDYVVRSFVRPSVTSFVRACGMC